MNYPNLTDIISIYRCPICKRTRTYSYSEFIHKADIELEMMSRNTGKCIYCKEDKVHLSKIEFKGGVRLI